MNPDQSQSPYRKSGYDVKIESKEKDMLISQLKAHIFELQQHEKDYDILNQKYRQVQNDCSLINEAKIRWEYELRQKDESYNKQISDWRNENENLQLAYNEKLAVNKKLFAENSTLEKQMDMKSEEIKDLTDRINDLMAQLDKTQEDQAGLERVVQGWTDIKSSQKVEISKLVEDNKKLSKICQEQDRSMKLGEQERQKLSQRIDESNYDLKNWNGKLQSREESINYLQSQLEDSKNLNLKLQGTIKDYERQFDSFKNDLNNLKQNLDKERQCRSEDEKRNEQLEVMLNDRERELNRMNTELEKTKDTNARINDDKLNSQMENDKLRNHIMVLTQQNQKWIAEIENVIDQDNQMKDQLSRKDRIVVWWRSNKSTLENSLNSLDDFLNRSNNTMQRGEKRNEGKYTYNRMSPTHQ